LSSPFSHADCAFAPGSDVLAPPASQRDLCRHETAIIAMLRPDRQRQIDLDYRRSIANAVEDFCNVAVTDEAQEGLRAFVEKRPPKW
jgi:enoyl-CoA hydratase/carnithine racemase